MCIYELCGVDGLLLKMCVMMLGFVYMVVSVLKLLSGWFLSIRCGVLRMGGDEMGGIGCLERGESWVVRLLVC